MKCLPVSFYQFTFANCPEQMKSLFSSKPLAESSTEELKKQEASLIALIYVAAAFIIAQIGYAIFRLVSQEINSVSELTSGTVFSLCSFGASLFFSTYVLKKVRAELSAREQ